MLKRILFFVATALLIGIMAISYAPSSAQTVPTPTPPGGGGGNPTNTPAPPQPTNTPQPPPATSTAVPVPPTNTPVQPGATNTPVPPASATNTPTPTRRATATPVPGVTETVSGTPATTPATTPGVNGGPPVIGVNAQLPDSDCGVPPVIVVTAREAPVYEGPGRNYDLVTLLERDSVRVIIGRYQYGPYWYIQLDKTTGGWVAAFDVDTVGNTTNMPNVTAPAHADGTPTPVPNWNPTPDVTCSGTPTATSTPKSRSTALVSEDAGTDVVDVTTDEAQSAENTAPEDEVRLVPVVEAAALDSELESSSGAVAETGQSAESASQSPSNEVEATPVWPLLAGLGLIGIAGATFVVMRNRNPEQPG